MTSELRDLYDFDYDSPEPYVGSAARVQAGFSTLGNGGRIWRTVVEVDGTHEELSGGYQWPA